MKGDDHKKILIFTTSREKNGTAKLRDTVESEIPDHFRAVRTYFEFFKVLLFERKKIEAIFALSNMHFFVALALVKKLRFNVPVVLGMYHPNQWKIYASDKVSKTRYKLFQQLCFNLTHDNIIHSSKEGVEATNFYCNIKTGTPTILQGPAEILPFLKAYSDGSNNNTIKIATIGRLVDFKICTILAMINAVERLSEKEHLDIEYDIYGEGPSKPVLEKRICESKIKDKINLLSFVPKEKYLETVIQYDLFFGMAGALILAASAGVPSLIAIQEETTDVSYGFISDYNQEENPIFGDRSRFAVQKPLTESIMYYAKLPADEKRALSRKCSDATYSYSTASTMERLIDKIKKAKPVQGINVSLMSLLRIIFEVRKSARRGVLDEHT